MEEEKIQLTLQSNNRTEEMINNNIPIMESVKKKIIPTYSAGTIDESMLSEEEKR